MLKFSIARRGWASLLLLLTAAATPAAFAVPGDFDTTFGSGFGKVLTTMGTGDDYANAVVLQPDGKLIAGGTCYSASPSQFCLVRYLPDGAIDTSFGTSGRVFTTAPGAYATLGGLILQPDGRIVATGDCYYVPTTSTDFCAARYLANGAPDNSFDGDGFASHNFAATSSLTTIRPLLQTDGRIVIPATCSAGGWIYYFCMTRLSADGAVDGAFVNGGFVMTQIFARDYAASAALQPDGKIVIAGRCQNGSNGPFLFCAVRHLPGGPVDPSFSGDGIVATPVGNGLGDDFVSSVLVQLDGKLMLGGRCRVNPSSLYQFCLLRYLPDGMVDSSVGASGLIINMGTTSSTVHDLQRAPDGKLLLAGSCRTGSLSDFCVARIHADGQLDLSFASNGRRIVSMVSGDEAPTQSLLQPDGKHVIAGMCVGATNQDFCIARFEGGPFTAQACSLDIDGDNRVTATVDSLLHARIALGMSGAGVVGGIIFPAGATRTTWPAIRAFLTTQCGMTLPA